jgi:hypothetical protein
VVDLFEGARCGFFVEAGALDGLAGNCTLTLERHFGWKVILVEPGLAFPALVVNRPGCICENVCLAGSSGIVLFVDASDSGYSGIMEKLSSMSARTRSGGGISGPVAFTGRQGKETL